MQRPLIPILVAFMTGITIGNFYRVDDRLLLALFLIILLLLFAALVKKLHRLIAVSVILSSIILGILNINLYLYQEPGPKHIASYIGKEKLIVEGMISENPRVSPERTELTVTASRLVNDETYVYVEGDVLLAVAGRQEFKYGDYIRFKTRLRAPRSFRNPGGFDYEKHLRYKGIMVRGFIKDSGSIVVMRENQGNFFKMKLERFRNDLKKFLEENSLTPEREIIQAMILGEHKEIPKEVMEKFNKTGTTHIIAISGFNIGIIAFISFFAVRLIMKSSTHLLLRFNIIKASTVFGIIPVIFYTLIAGMGISVVRASIMALTFMISVIFGRERDFYNTLALAALIILIFSPSSLFDVSFQLSFMAVWAILFITPKVIMSVPKDNPPEGAGTPAPVKKIVYNIYLFIIVSLAATLGTLPLIIFYFNRVSTVTLLANLVVVPVMGIITIPLCMLIIIAVPLSHALALIFLNISSFLVRLSIAMVDFFASLPGSSFFVSTPTLLEIAAYYLFLILAVKLIDIRRDSKKEIDQPDKRMLPSPRWLLASLIALTAFFVGDAIYLYSLDYKSEKLKITFIDVGQGSSTLIKLPGGKKILVDGGGTYENIFDIGKYVIGPFLWYERVKDIDIVVLTHPHPDHLNGLLYVLTNFDVKEVWTNGEKGDTETFEDFMKILQEKNITHRLVSEKTGDIEIDNVKISILNPANPVCLNNPQPRKFDKTNNDAIVIKLTFGNVNLLLPADISEPTETLLVKSGKDLKSRIMLVPHHGGFTSSTMAFLEKVRPEVAVVSCGRDNTFNDPHPDVLKRYMIGGARVLRTDLNGAVTITTDGANITFDSFFKPPPTPASGGQL